MNILRMTGLLVLQVSLVGCFQMSDSVPSVSDNGSLGGEGEDGLQVIDGTSTAAILASNHVVPSLQTLTGVPASAQTISVFAAKRDIFAYEGDYNSVNAPMMMSFALVSAEMCNDLVRAEKALPAASRKFFSDINYGAGPNAVNGTQVGAIIDRMGMSFWGRSPSVEEKADISSTVLGAYMGQTATAQTDLMSVFLCTAMLSSFSTVSF